MTSLEQQQPNEAQKKLSRSKYIVGLTKPVERHEPPLALSFPGREKELAEFLARDGLRITYEMTKKYDLLFAHYGLEQGEWFMLAVHLAKDHVRGCQVVEDSLLLIGTQKNTTKNLKRGKRWREFFELTIKLIKSASKKTTGKNITDKEACTIYKLYFKDAASIRTLQNLLLTVRKLKASH